MITHTLQHDGTVTRTVPGHTQILQWQRTHLSWQAFCVLETVVGTKRARKYGKAFQPILAEHFYGPMRSITSDEIKTWLAHVRAGEVAV